MKLTRGIKNKFPSNFRFCMFTRDQGHYKHISDRHLGDGSECPDPFSFFIQSQLCPQILQFGRNALKIQFQKRKNSSKRCTNGILLKFFNTTLRRTLKCGTKECGINFWETTFDSKLKFHIFNSMAAISHLSFHMLPSYFWVFHNL